MRRGGRAIKIRTPEIMSSNMCGIQNHTLTAQHMAANAATGLHMLMMSAKSLHYS